MADDEGKTDGDGKGSDEFDPKSLSPEAQEYIRKNIQSESDSKSALVEKRLQDAQAATNRQAIETAEQNEDNRLAAIGDLEGLGARVKSRLDQRSVRNQGVVDASDIIEKQIGDGFSESLGPERVEEIRRKVVSEQGAHAEFAKALADATEGKTRSEEIAAEVKAQLMEARGEKRDEIAGGDKALGAGQGNPPSAFEELEQGYIDGNVSRETYETAKKARGKGQ